MLLLALTWFWALGEVSEMSYTFRVENLRSAGEFGGHLFSCFRYKVKLQKFTSLLLMIWHEHAIDLWTHKMLIKILNRQENITILLRGNFFDSHCSII